MALLADLQQQRAQVVAVLLDDGVAIAGDPDIVPAVDEAAVQPFGRTAASPHAFTTLPCVDHTRRRAATATATSVSGETRPLL